MWAAFSEHLLCAGRYLQTSKLNVQPEALISAPNAAPGLNVPVPSLETSPPRLTQQTSPVLPAHDFPRVVSLTPPSSPRLDLPVLAEARGRRRPALGLRGLLLPGTVPGRKPSLVSVCRGHGGALHAQPALKASLHHRRHTELQQDAPAGLTVTTEQSPGEGDTQGLGHPTQVLLWHQGGSPGTQCDGRERRCKDVPTPRAAPMPLSSF